jgi:hypothetical protein
MSRINRGEFFALLGGFVLMPLAKPEDQNPNPIIVPRPARTSTPTPIPTNSRLIRGSSGQEENWRDLVSGTPGLTAPEKWFEGSLGMDIFLRRDTRVNAPFAGTVYKESHNGMVLVATNGFTARFRHVTFYWEEGERVTLGQEIARVFDSNLEMLRWPGRIYGTPPDGFQHLDLSIAGNRNRLIYQGGAGGDIDAYDYVRNHGGLPSMTIIPRTPGPMEGLPVPGGASGIIRP